jgi:hypothetical protein
MSERTNRQCIVLLPSGPHHDRLFREILEPVIADAGLAPSQVQQDSSSPIPIDLFVDEIEDAEVLLADVSGNTPEIWIAAGCAMALGKPLCLISSALEERPLGIQYLPLIPYPANAFPDDYIQLQQNIADRLSAILAPQNFDLQNLDSQSFDRQSLDLRSLDSESLDSQNLTLRNQPEPEPQATSRPSIPIPPPIPPADDLAPYEVIALTIIDVRSTDAGLSPRDLGIEMKIHDSAHLTSHAMNSLKRRQFIEKKPIQLNYGNEVHFSENLFLTRAGKEWLMRYHRRVASHRSTSRPRIKTLNR